MSYLVFARKYRPLVFEDVVGQEHVTRTLTNAIKNGRVAHAYLFAGARGVGKTTVARILAMAMNCISEGEIKPCGQCEVCREISSGQALDVFEIDGASNRGIDDIRELRETVKYLPTKGEYKVYIIDEVHMLSPQAFNALLKTLEEPPAHVVFIFATTEAHKLPATIISRCQRYEFKRITLVEIIAQLELIARKENIDVDSDSLRLIGRESEGSLRDALSLMDQVIAFCGADVSRENVVEALGLIDRSLVHETVEALLAGNAGQAIDLLDKVYGFGYDTKEFTLQLLQYFRSLVVVKVSAEPNKILDLLDAELEEIQALADSVSLETLNFFFNALLASTDNLRRSTDHRLALESLMVKLAQAEPVQAIAEMAARLESLLASMGGDIKLARLAQPDSMRKAPARQVKPPSTVEPPEPVRVQEHVENNNASEEVSADEPATPARLEPGEEADWDSFLNFIKTRKRALHAYLQKAGARTFSRDELVLVCEKKVEADQIEAAKEGLSDALFDFFQSRPDIRTEVEEGAVQKYKPEESDQHAPPETPEEREEAVRSHPLVQSASEILDGEIVKIIPKI